MGRRRVSLGGTAKLTGSPLASERRRVWEPRIRTTGKSYSSEDLKTYYFIGSVTVFPLELREQGLSQEVLFSTLELVRAGNVDHAWKLCGTPTIGFYRKLHTYLKRHPKLSKVLIGRLYSVIDRNFQEKGSRPDNIFSFVDSIMSSKRPSDDPMLYNIPVVKSTSSMLKKCSQQIEELNTECVELRKKIEASRTQLRATNCALRDITNENQHLKRKCEVSKMKMDKLRDKNEQLETVCSARN